MYEKAGKIAGVTGAVAILPGSVSHALPVRPSNDGFGQVIARERHRELLREKETIS